MRRHGPRRADRHPGPRRARHLDDGPVIVTYGDCVGDVDVTALLAFHRGHGRLATVTAVHPPGPLRRARPRRRRRRASFLEKPQTSAGTINGGFMVFEREAIERYIPVDDDVMLEREPMSGLAGDGELWPTSTTASGCPWTRPASATSWRACGTPSARRGGSW